jgi:6-phosphogluconolactonase (cycloisomerase 2 family)
VNNSTYSTQTGKTIVYGALGPVMKVFEVDTGTAELTKVGEVKLPAGMQYAWPNKARTLMYYVTSDAGPMQKTKLPNHYIQVYKILKSGMLEPHGEAIKLSNRPLHCSLDIAEKHLLVAYNDPAEMTIHEILPDGRVGEIVKQKVPLDFAITPHQVRVTPHDNIIVFPTRGHHPMASNNFHESPGSVQLYAYDSSTGLVTKQLPPIAPNGGYGFGARHVDFHPTKPWMFLLVESQNDLHVYDYSKDGIDHTPRFNKSCLEGTEPGKSRQLTSAIHFHPNGRFIYVSNRAHDTEEFKGQKVFTSGVNDITVFSVNQETGEPTLIQHIDTKGIFPRTFALDPTGKVLVAGNEDPWLVREGDEIVKVPASLVTFKVGDDGKLTFVKKYDHEDNGEVCFWIGVERIPA